MFPSFKFACKTHIASSFLHKQDHSHFSVCFASSNFFCQESHLVTKLSIQNCSTYSRTQTLEKFFKIFATMWASVYLHTSTFFLSELEYINLCSGFWGVGKWAWSEQQELNAAVHIRMKLPTVGNTMKAMKNVDSRSKWSMGPVPLASRLFCLKFGLLLYMPLSCFGKTSCVAITYL